MKRMVALLVLVAWLINCAPTIPHYKYHVYERKQPIVINERVGETIDPEEREQFDLFHGIGAFKEAKFYATEDGGYVVEIATESGELIAVNRDQDAVMILRDYVSKYEEIRANPTTFEKKWGIIEYDYLGFPITQREVSRNTKSCCMTGGTVGCGLGSLGVSAVVAYAAAFSGDWEFTPFLAIVIGGTFAGIVSGSLLGRTMDRDRAITAIREARVPRRVKISGNK